MEMRDAISSRSFLRLEFEMNDFHLRVVAEKEELDKKIAGLGSFFGKEIFATVPSEERQRLLDQYHAMRKYSDILADRIANFVV